MNTTYRDLALTALLSAAVLAGVGCGQSSSCKTESAALEVSTLPKICAAVAPGASVAVPLHLCPACYQSAPVCDVEIQDTGIFLDARVEACDAPSSCDTVPSCLSSVTTCSFKAPSREDTYDVTIYDAGTGGTSTIPLQVSSGGSSSTTCG
jgi:hypothetical protein